MILSPEQFNSAYKKLPFILREYIADDDLSTICESIGKEYGLHVDTIGALYRETTNMLLGLEDPTQFMGELKSVGIPQENIGAMIKELNEKVFMPLRERMQKEGDGESFKEDEGTIEKIEEELDIRPSKETSSEHIVPQSEPTVEVASTVSPLSPVMYSVQPTYKIEPPVIDPLPEVVPAPSVPGSGGYSYSPPSVVTTSPEIQAPQVAPAPVFQRPPATQALPVPIPAPYQVAPGQVQSYMRTMAQDMAEAKAKQHQHSGTEPSFAHQGPQPQNTAQMFHQPLEAPVVTSPVSSMPIPQTPRAPLPTATIGSVSVPMQRVEPPTFVPTPPSPSAVLIPEPKMDTVPMPSSNIRPQPLVAPAMHAPLSPAPKSTPLTANQQQLHQILKEYGVDPYREPVE